MLKQTARSFRALIIVFALIMIIIAVVRSPIFWKVAFPIAYRDLIWKSADDFDVDPYLVAAVVRVESKFYPKALSPKGAIGLMQLMPETASWGASELNMSGFTTEALYEPETNIRLGTWYISKLMKQFDGDVVLVLAAYNGGSGNVSQWLQREIWSGREHNLDDIPFPETRNYVWKVLRNYRAYKDIYNN